MTRLTRTALAAGVALLILGPAEPTAQVNPWNYVSHGACCEANLAAWGDHTFVLAPRLATANQIFRSTDGGRSWDLVYPPVNVSVPFGVEGDLAAWGPPFLPDVTVNYFGTQVADGAAAVTNDGGDNWTVTNFPAAFPANDQAWIYMSRMAVPACEGIPGAVPYALAGWFRIGSVALFSCDGGLTWPVQTPLIGLNGSGPEHVVCQELAATTGSETDTRIPMASFEKMKAHRHGGWGTDGRFYWSEGAGFSIYVCRTNDFGATWEGFVHTMAIGTPQFNNTVTSMAFDQNGTLYVLHTNQLYVSYNQGQSFRFTHTLPRWGNDPSVGDTSGQAFTIDDGTIHIALKDASHRVWYLRGDGVDGAAPVWTEELVLQGNVERLDFIQIVVDGRGVPTIGYTSPNGEPTFTSSRDLEPVAVDDNAEAITAQTTVIDVLENDHDPDDTVLVVTEASDPASGTVNINPDNTISYESDAGFVGQDSFTYTIADPPGLEATATVFVDVGASVGVEANTVAPALRLGPIRPNPFQRVTSVGFELAAPGDVRLEVYTAAGRRVATLREGTLAAGRHQVSWEAIDSSGGRLPAGLYFVRLSAGGRSVTERLSLVR